MQPCTQIICLLKAKIVLFFPPKLCPQAEQNKREDVSLVFHIFYVRNMTNMEQKYVYEARQLNCLCSPVIFGFVLFFFFYVRNVRKRGQQNRYRAIYLKHFSSLEKKKKGQIVKKV